MKSIRKIAIVSLISLFVISGCSNPGENSSAPLPTYLSEKSSDLPFENVSTPTEQESPYLDYLGTESLTKTDGYILYFGTYGQNAQDQLVTQELVSRNRLSERLTERISSDLSPDLCEKPDNAYYLITKNMFEDLTKYIDTSAPQWQEYSEYLEAHKFNNGNYFYPTSIKQSPYFLAYSSDYYGFKVNGNKTPTELWREGKWDYAALSKIISAGSVKISVKYDSAAEIDLLNAKSVPIENLLISSGLPIIDIGSDGKYFSNLNTDEFIKGISTIGNSITSTVRTMNSYQTNNFLSVNEKQLASIRKSGNDGYVGFNAEKLIIVPYPASPDGRYYGVTQGYLVPKRAKNIKAAASYINGSRIAARLSYFPDGLTDEDKEILTALREQSCLNMVESYRSYVDVETKRTVDKLWQYEDSFDTDKDAISQYKIMLTKALDELNQE